MFRNLACQLFRRSAIQSAARNCGPMIESLEQRQLLSITVNVGGSGGDTLFIRDLAQSNFSDDITVRLKAGDASTIEVIANGDTTEVPLASVARIRVDTYGGNDTVTMDDSNGSFNLPKFISLGRGFDTYFGISGRDIVSGGPNDDFINGRGSADSINGEGGNDTILGGGGSDFIAGSAGNDFIRGGNGGGFDRLFGGTGDDTILGENGNDEIQGQVGNDSLEGGDGRDFMLGGDDNDIMFGGDDEDTMFGDDGIDAVRGDGGDDIVGGDREGFLEIQGGSAEPSAVANPDELQGGDGNDTLLGHFGADTLIGGAGGDLFDARDPLATLVDRAINEAIANQAVYTPPAEVVRSISLGINIDGVPASIPFAAGSFPTGVTVAVANGADEFNQTIQFSDDFEFRSFTLFEFFDAWGKPITEYGIGRESFLRDPVSSFEMTVNGVPNTDFGDYFIADGDNIQLNLVGF